MHVVKPHDSKLAGLLSEKFKNLRAVNPTKVCLTAAPLGLFVFFL